MPDANLEDPTLLFLQIVWALDHGLQSHSKRMKTEKGVTGPQRLVLRILELQPGTGPSELARILRFHKSTATVILRSLERAKLVRRTPHAEDRRAVTLTLTSRGHLVARQRAGTVEAIVRKTFASLPQRKIQIAQEVLTALTAALA